MNDLAPFMLKRIRRTLRRRSTSLSCCRACGGDFVHPLEWRPEDDLNWWMLLRCGRCGLQREAIVGNLAAARFDRELDVAQAVMRRDAERLSREQLADEAERFARALELDLIDAEDFARA